MSACKVQKQNGTLPESFSLLSMNRENVIMETVKKAEHGEAVVARLYEAYNQRTELTLTAGFDFQKVYLCDLLENEEAVLQHDGRTVTLPVKPFEIITLKFER